MTKYFAQKLSGEQKHQSLQLIACYCLRQQFLELPTGVKIALNWFLDNFVANLGHLLSSTCSKFKNIASNRRNNSKTLKGSQLKILWSLFPTGAFNITMRHQCSYLSSRPNICKCCWLKLSCPPISLWYHGISVLPQTCAHFKGIGWPICHSIKIVMEYWFKAMFLDVVNISGMGFRFQST